MREKAFASSLFPSCLASEKWRGRLSYFAMGLAALQLLFSYWMFHRQAKISSGGRSPLMSNLLRFTEIEGRGARPFLVARVICIHEL